MYILNWTSLLAWILFIGYTTFTLGSVFLPLKTRSCRKRFQVLNNHSACLPSSPVLVKSGLSPGEEVEILMWHNYYRGIVDPPAENMLKMYWDAEVAVIAQNWADQCQMAHDNNYARHIPGRYLVGQSFMTGTHRFTWKAILRAWYNERLTFVFGENNAGKIVHHYTAMVWATTTRVGCGYAQCNHIHYWVCNYAPMGNHKHSINFPYKNGSRCNLCPGHCKEGLCDCGDVSCYNGGSVDPVTCQCKCLRRRELFGTSCNLKCSLVAEPFYCARGVYVFDNCGKYSNLMIHCPYVCRVCPWGGEEYVDYIGDTSTLAPGEVTHSLADLEGVSNVQQGSFVILTTMTCLACLTIHYFSK